MDVNVNQPRRHVKAGRIDCFQRPGGLYMFGYGGDFSIAQGHIPYGGQIVPGVDDAPPSYQ